MEADILAAQRASQSGVEELLRSHEAKVITKLVVAYRSQQLTADEAKIGVAVISELRTIVADVGRAIERGTEAVKQMTGTSR